MPPIATFLLIAAVAAAFLDFDAVLAGRRQTPGRIINGQPAQLGQFPYMAYIAADTTDLYAGTLITPSAVLTHAWVSYGYKSFTIRLGGIYRRLPEETVWIAESVWGMAHPQYEPGKFGIHGVGVILLHQKAPLSAWIQLVALPTFKESCEKYVGRHAIVAGWGRHNKSTPMSDILRFAEVTVIPNSLCQRHYAQGAIIDSSLCAGNDYAGHHIGDDGSPLVINTTDGVKQIAVAFTIETTQYIGRPGVHVRIGPYLKWIHEVVGEGVARRGKK